MKKLSILFIGIGFSAVSVAQTTKPTEKMTAKKVESKVATEKIEVSTIPSGKGHRAKAIRKEEAPLNKKVQKK